MSTALFWSLIIGFYLLPAIICEIRGTRHGWSILAINLFLGWTVLGWIAALIWAITEAPQSPDPQERPWSDQPLPNPPERKYETYYHRPE